MDWSTIFYSALVASIIGHGLFFHLVQRHPVTAIMPYLQLMPLFGIVFGILVWGDRPGWRLYIGGAVVLLGILIITAPGQGKDGPAKNGMITSNVLADLPQHGRFQELGADDYVTKPFSVTELVARVKAIFRRVESIGKTIPGAGEAIEIASIKIDPASRQVTVGREPVNLTAREFDLLLHFARHPGLVFSRAQLLDQVWGYGHEGYEHTVNSHINRLRAKIEPDSAHPSLIVTVWGVGYKLDPEPLAASAA